LVLRVRGLTIEESAATRDPVSGTAYLALLAAFGAMPFLVRRSRRPAKVACV